MDYDLSVTVRRPPDAVYAALADIQRYVDPDSPVPEMEKIPAGPTTLGTRWREVVRLGPVVTMTMWSEVTAIEPDRRLEERFRGPWMTGVLVYPSIRSPVRCAGPMARPTRGTPKGG